MRPVPGAIPGFPGTSKPWPLVPHRRRCRPELRGYDAELLQPAQLVHAQPVPNNLAVPHAHDVDVLQRDTLPRRRNPAEIPGMRSTERLLRDDAVALRDHVVDRELSVRIRVREHAEPHPSAFAVGRNARRRAQIDELRVGQLVVDREVLLVLHLLDKSPDDRLVPLDLAGLTLHGYLPSTK